MSSRLASSGAFAVESSLTTHISVCTYGRTQMMQRYAKCTKRNAPIKGATATTTTILQAPSEFGPLDHLSIKWNAAEESESDIIYKWSGGLLYSGIQIDNTTSTHRISSETISHKSTQIKYTRWVNTTPLLVLVGFVLITQMLRSDRFD